MKKYLFVIPSLSKGGAERVVSVLASELTKQKRQAVIVTHFIAENEYPVNYAVKVVCLSGLRESDYRKKLTKTYLLQLVHELRKVILEEKPDYILPFLWTTCIRVDIALMVSNYKKRVIQTVRNNPYVFPENKFAKKYRNHLVNKSGLIIVQNETQKRYFPDRWEDKINVLPNPVSEKLFSIEHICSDGLFRIVGVGRLEKQKNFELLIDAVAEVHKAYPSIRLDIFGEGSLKQELQNQINRLALTDTIALRGRSSDYSEIYGKASAFVLSSDFEGMPNTLLEAMVVGLPCISTNCPTGPSDIIQPFENGLLIPVGDKKELCAKIELLISDEALCQKIGVNAKNTVINSYSPDKITRRLISICE